MLSYPQDVPVVAAIWGAQRACAARCEACAWAWHGAQAELAEELRQLQLQAAQHAQHAQHGPHGGGGGQPPQGEEAARAEARRHLLEAALRSIRRLEGARLQQWLEAGAAAVLVDAAAAGGGERQRRRQGGEGEEGEEEGEAMDGASAEALLTTALQETLVW